MIEVDPLAQDLVGAHRQPVVGHDPARNQREVVVAQQCTVRVEGHRPDHGRRVLRISVSWSGSTGLTSIASNPASSALRRSSGWPYPVMAARTMRWPCGAVRILRATL